MVRRVHAPCVAYPFDVKRGVGLVCPLDWGRMELDHQKARLTGDETHCSRMPEEVPPPINVIVVVGHGVGEFLSSPAATPAAPPP